MGFEPTTASLEGWNSTTELRPPLLSVSSAECSVLRLTFQLTSLLRTQHSNSKLARVGGQARIRTLEADGNRFTVCPLWPLGYLPENPCTQHNN